VLAGYEHPEQDVAHPSLECLSNDDKVSLEHITQAMFTENFHQPQLKPFRNCIVASFLMYYEDFVSKYGQEHSIVRKFEEQCRYYDVSPARIVRMGRLIAVDVRFKNAANVHRVIAKKSDNGQAAAAQVSRLEALEKENAALKSKLDDMTALMERLLSGVDTLVRAQQHPPVQVPVHMETPNAPAVMQPPRTPVAATDIAGAAQNVADVAAPNAFDTMRENLRRGLGEWNISTTELTTKKYTQFLIDRRTKLFNLEKKVKLGTVSKQAKQKLKVLFNWTIKAAAESGDTDLVRSAEEMRCNTLPPDHKSYPDEHSKWKSEICRMAKQLVVNLETSLGNEFLSSARRASATDAAVEKELNKIKDLVKKNNVGSMMSFFEKEIKKWDTVVPGDEISP
jgi:hypothetical protein